MKVPFPGIGNDLKLEVPVTVTSGIDKPLPKEQSGRKDGENVQPPPTLDLPPYVTFAVSHEHVLRADWYFRAYWDATDKDWTADEKD